MLIVNFRKITYCTSFNSFNSFHSTARCLFFCYYNVSLQSRLQNPKSEVKVCPSINCSRYFEIMCWTWTLYNTIPDASYLQLRALGFEAYAGEKWSEAAVHFTQAIDNFWYRKRVQSICIEQCRGDSDFVSYSDIPTLRIQGFEIC